MIENLFDILLAREQVMLLFGGIFMVLLGIVFIADHYWWRMHATRYLGLWSRALPTGLILAGIFILLAATSSWFHINRRANQL